MSTAGKDAAPVGLERRPFLVARCWSLRGALGVLLACGLVAGCARTTEQAVHVSAPSAQGMTAIQSPAAAIDASNPNPSQPGPRPAASSSAATTGTPAVGPRHDAAVDLGSSGSTAVPEGPCTTGPSRADASASGCELPPSVCESSLTLVFFQNPSCDQGHCVWESKRMTCPSGSCQNGACRLSTTK